ncbi:hypothetical protein [Knoellia flava]|uniref:Glycerophosphodiester phosphodiesterase n=1 Tax=Knoellia flava TaxID=913969 RepID=A0A8H9FUH1_9MICO|nr:hypothetical protein [Knoellia flava]GGB79602.1 hypothetical protein GCM10011314_19020 [Knoellia flava]
MRAPQTLAALALAAAPFGIAAPAQAVPDAPVGNAVLPQKTHFDLQAHRGGLGLTTESTPEAFAKALELA